MGLAVNLAVRQCLLELLYAFVGDLGVAEAQPFKLGQTFQVLQAGVGDLGIAKPHYLGDSWIFSIAGGQRLLIIPYTARMTAR